MANPANAVAMSIISKLFAMVISRQPKVQSAPENIIVRRLAKPSVSKGTSKKAMKQPK
jgi:hypothetical protein